MQTLIMCLMELQEEHQLNCPLRGDGVAGEWSTPVVLPSSCPTKLLRHHDAALSSALLFCSFSGSDGGLLCTKTFTFSRRMDINYTASGGQLVISSRSVKCQRKRHHPSVNSTLPSEPALMEQWTICCQPYRQHRGPPAREHGETPIEQQIFEENVSQKG